LLGFAKAFESTASLIGKKEKEEAANILQQVAVSFDLPKNGVAPAAPSQVGTEAELPKEVSEIFHQWIVTLGLSDSQIRAAEELFAWALGEDVRPLFAGLKGVEKVAPVAAPLMGFEWIDEEPEAVAEIEGDFSKWLSKPPPRGVIGSLYYSIYFTLLLELISWGLTISQWVKGFSWTSVLLLLQTFGAQAARKMIPEDLYNWLYAILQQTMQAFAKFFVAMLMRAVLSKQKMGELQEILEFFKGHVKPTVKLLQGESLVSFGINPGVQITPPGGESC
jgi:hypothetical protein